MEGEQETVEDLDMSNFVFHVWMPPRTGPVFVAPWVKKTAVPEKHFGCPHPLETPWKMSNRCRMLLWVFQRSMQPFLDSWMQIELDLCETVGIVAANWGVSPFHNRRDHISDAQSEWDRGNSNV